MGDELAQKTLQGISKTPANVRVWLDVGILMGIGGRAMSSRSGTESNQATLEAMAFDSSWVNFLLLSVVNIHSGPHVSGWRSTNALLRVPISLQPQVNRPGAIHRQRFLFAY